MHNVTCETNFLCSCPGWNSYYQTISGINNLSTYKLFHSCCSISKNKELQTIDPADMCSTSYQVFKFVSPKTFKLCTPEDVCKAIDETCNLYKGEVITFPK